MSKCSGSSLLPMYLQYTISKISQKSVNFPPPTLGSRTASEESCSENNKNNKKPRTRAYNEDKLISFVCMQWKGYSTLVILSNSGLSFQVFELSMCCINIYIFFCAKKGKLYLGSPTSSVLLTKLLCRTKVIKFHRGFYKSGHKFWQWKCKLLFGCWLKVD